MTAGSCTDGSDDTARCAFVLDRVYYGAMCGRYSLDTTPAALTKRFEVRSVPADTSAVRPNYNVSPGQQLPIIVESSSGDRQIEMMHWGIRRIVGKDTTREIINARDDKAFSGFWRKTVCTRRCLIPATGFYEWQTTAKGKIPFLIKPRDEALFAFAGIWDVWRDGAGKEVVSYAIITTEANAEMRAVHDRMPVMLHRDDETAWLSAENSTPETLEGLLYPSEDGRLELHEVSLAVNNPRNNSPDLLVPKSD